MLGIGSLRIADHLRHLRARDHDGAGATPAHDRSRQRRRLRRSSDRRLDARLTVAIDRRTTVSPPTRRRRDMQIEPGMVAVVTGAGSGIGLAMSNAFAALGCSVVLADVQADALDCGGHRGRRPRSRDTGRPDRREQRRAGRRTRPGDPRTVRPGRHRVQQRRRVRWWGRRLVRRDRELGVGRRRRQHVGRRPRRPRLPAPPGRRGRRSHRQHLVDARSVRRHEPDLRRHQARRGRHEPRASTPRCRQRVSVSA